ncbi:MAG: GNAT family N-acetyltransferase [Nesterenkonia sp.]
MSEHTGNILSTPRLMLRAPTEADADFVRDMYARREVTQHIGTHDWVETTHQQALVRIERYRAQFGPASGVWLVETNDRVPVGFTLLKAIPFSAHVATETGEQDTEIGWHLHPDSWGSGFAVEAAQALIRHARAQGLTALVAVTHADNAASHAVARRAEMSYAGTTTRYYDATCELFTISL